MQIVWKEVVGTQQEKPLEVDTTSSPSTVYLRKNITKVEKKAGDETISAWKYEEAQLTPEEYKEYLEISQIFNTPEMEVMKTQMEDQQLVLASVAANTEYVACLQELNM